MGDAEESEAKRSRTAAPAVDSLLILGDGSDLEVALKGIAGASALDALVIFSLGADHSKVLAAVQSSGVSGVPIYFTETYGILGFDEARGSNVELMEKGRGSEYGCQGGDGGQGVLLLAYSGGTFKAAHEAFPEEASSMMVIADTSGNFAKVKGAAPAVYYGGITKEAYVFDVDGARFAQIPHFFVAASLDAGPVGVAAFTGDAAEATEGLLAKMPDDVTASGAVGLFPCFTRGINEYGRNDVEPTAISAKMPGCRIYGMFAHGELGPSSFAGFSPPAPPRQPCTQHSMTSILALHTSMK